MESTPFSLFNFYFARDKLNMFRMMLNTQALLLSVVLNPILIVQVLVSCNLAMGYFFAEILAMYFGESRDVVDVVRSKEEEENTFVVVKTPEKFITYNVHDMSFKEILSFSRYSYEGPSIFHRYIMSVIILL
ncbi:hypothetical protein Hanom_Chr07g00606461 [Helianthus anomalus]